MTTRDRKNIEKGLKRKGFNRVESHHHYFIYWTLSGKKTAVRTRTSHGSKSRTLGDSLLGKMADQCGGLSKRDFLKLVDCTLSREDFECLAGILCKSEALFEESDE